MSTDLIKIVKKLSNLKRYHNSSDMHAAVKILVDIFGGTEDIYSDNFDTTWSIPKCYKVHYARLFRNGKVIADYEVNPLCLWSYSTSYHGTLALSALSKHILTDANRPNARIFHFRNQYRREKNIWGFSIPFNEFSTFRENDIFNVEIKTSFSNHPMKQYFLGDIKKKNIILVAHLDHPNQVNDGLSSCIINNHVTKKLNGRLKTINLISLNSIEIIGTVLFLRKYKLDHTNTLGAICTNGLMSNYEIKFQYSSKNGNCELDQLLVLYQKIYYESVSDKISDFREGWGNDEVAFEVPGVEIPCISMFRFIEKEYHSDLDNLGTIEKKNSIKSCELLSDLIEAIDSDRAIEAHFDHLLCLSSPKINLYFEPSEVSGIDSKYNSLSGELFLNLSRQEMIYITDNQILLHRFMNQFMPFIYNAKKPTILELSLTCSLPPKFVFNYLSRLEKFGFISLNTI